MRQAERGVMAVDKINQNKITTENPDIRSVTEPQRITQLFGAGRGRDVGRNRGLFGGVTETDAYHKTISSDLR